MSHANSPIGVMDSGVGGLTVVRELQRLCPGEDLVYFGDSANCPYGNRPQQEIRALSQKMLRFLDGQGVKAVAVACNTISTLVDQLTDDIACPILGIVSPVAEAVAQAGIRRVGVFATEFTVSTGNYQALIARHDPTIEVFGKGSPHLAALIDRGDFDRDAIDCEIQKELGALLATTPLDHVILGCTHFPLVIGNFERCFPGITYIDPASAQAHAVAACLAARNEKNPRETSGHLRLFTSGNPDVFGRIAQRLGLRDLDAISQQAL